jgi:thiosulfate dehydrogenase
MAPCRGNVDCCDLTTRYRHGIPSLNNAAAILPGYNPRLGRAITLQGLIHNCIMGAVQGTPPAYDSAEMADPVSYLSSLSQGKPMQMGGKPE